MALDSLQIKYDALQTSYESLLNDLKRKGRIIDSLKEQNGKFQSIIETYETNSNHTDSIDSGSTKNIYEKNLEIISESVTEDEYKFMEDLSREKRYSFNTPISPRSRIAAKVHTDAEQEYFLLTVLSCKIDLATKGCSNAAVSDVNNQILWNRAQEQSLSMHQFHDWIMSELLKVYTQTQENSIPIKHTWNTTLSHQNISNRLQKEICDKINDKMLRVDPKETEKYVVTYTKESPKQLKDEEQIYTDEESDYDDDEDVMYIQ
eukprot:736913_1